MAEEPDSITIDEVRTLIPSKEQQLIGLGENPRDVRILKFLWDFIQEHLPEAELIQIEIGKEETYPRPHESTRIRFLLPKDRRYEHAPEDYLIKDGDSISGPMGSLHQNIQRHLSSLMIWPPDQARHGNDDIEGYDSYSIDLDASSQTLYNRIALYERHKEDGMAPPRLPQAPARRR